LQNKNDKEEFAISNQLNSFPHSKLHCSVSRHEKNIANDDRRKTDDAVLEEKELLRISTS
jgi:hypothetical protein